MRLWHRCFHVNFAKFLRTVFLQQTSGGCVLPYLCRLIAQNTFLKPVPLISCMKKKLIAFVGFLIKLPWNISNGGNVFLEMFFIKGKNVPGNGLWILSSRRWLTKLCLFYKIAVNKSPNYLYNYVSTDNQSYQTRNGSKFLHMCRRTEYFPNSLFPYTIKEWNTLCPVICKSVL